jgi:hypothetical protein
VAALIFLAISSIAVWDDGRRFARVKDGFHRAPEGIAAASYLDASRIDWKTADELHEYATEHRQALVDWIQEARTP